MRKLLLRKSQFLASVLSVLVCVFLVSAFVYAATTIGTNIDTAGTITTTDYGQFNNVSTTDTLYAGGYASSTGGFYTLASAHLGTDLTVDGNASTSGYVSVGTYLKLTPSATPTPVSTGMCFIHTTSKHLKCYDGVAWLEAI